MSGDAELEAFIARVRKMGAAIRDDAAKESAPLVMAASRSTAAAGTDPYGEPWRPRKDGSRAIPNAADAIDAVARGTFVIIRVFRGAAIQNVLSESVGRRVIPDGSKPLPAAILAALKEGATRAFNRGMGR